MADSRKFKYDELFNNQEDKAKAFDLIAERYYKGNFGQMQKSDFETLLFSIYIEQILKTSEDDMNTYSDYNLSKELGITQPKVSNLKVKKQLQYPYERFNWRESFMRICENAIYENGKIVLNIPDKNLFIEVQNWVEENKGYIDVQLNSKVLKISPEYYIDLVLSIIDGEDARKIKNELLHKIQQKLKINKETNEELIGDVLNKNAKELTLDIVSDILSDITPVSNETIKNVINKIETIFKKIYREHIKKN